MQKRVSVNLKQQIHYLGYIITKDDLMMDATKVEAIVNWPHPTNIAKLQVFLGLTRFYQKYIQDYSKLIVLVDISIM